MIIKFQLADSECTADLNAGCSIAIATNFEGKQPNHFSAQPASRKPYEIGSFVGRTEQGGSCNVDVVSLVTHCNGTHTESVAHIVDDAVHVGDVAPRGMMLALLITVAPVPAAETNESYRPELEQVDRVVTAESIKEAVNGIGMTAGTSPEMSKRAGLTGSISENVDALMIRTVPNNEGKKENVYGEDNQPPFLTCDAMSVIEDLEISHLLVDVPSIDRMYDDGLLTNHHLYWNVPESTHKISESSNVNRTITEMIFVPDHRSDGVYLLDMECPEWMTDAAPSRPVIFEIANVL